MTDTDAFRAGERSASELDRRRGGRAGDQRPAAPASARHVGWPSLTPTEQAVVALVAEGLSNPDIAERLFISRSTVKTHLNHVFTKLDVSSRAELAVGLHPQDDTNERTPKPWCAATSNCRESRGQEQPRPTTRPDPDAGGSRAAIAPSRRIARLAATPARNRPAVRYRSWRSSRRRSVRAFRCVPERHIRA